MKQIRISDITMKQPTKAFTLTFKEKIELAKLLDKLGVSVIELEGIQNNRVDSLCIKSISSAVQNATVAVPVALNEENIHLVWAALSTAKHPRLQVHGAVSSVQMEYLYHKKPEAMLQAVAHAIRQCASLCADVEFIAEDATRSDPAFLAQMIQTAISSGVSTVTLCDTAGTMLPDEVECFIRGLYEAAPELKDVTLGISCSNSLSMADACCISAICQGAGEIKASAYPTDSASLENVARILSEKAEKLQITSSIQQTQLGRIVNQIVWMCQTERSKKSPFDQGVQSEDHDLYLSSHDQLSSVLKMVEKLGYDLSDEDGLNVYAAFKEIVQKKEKISARELDAIVATAAMQVPSTYQLETYVITAGNTISATAHLRLSKSGCILEGVCIGDGPIDAAFLAIESITGHHYELDDFQIQAVTEGREAMGQTVVKLRSEGKIYSGRGTSTDIVGASIMAYLNALNKIVYEEADA